MKNDTAGTLSISCKLLQMYAKLHVTDYKNRSNT